MNKIKLRIRKNVKNPESNLFGKLELKRMNKHHDELTKWGLSFINLSEVKSILDVGCGGGNCLKIISTKASQNAMLYGVDISKESINTTKKNNSNLVKSDRLILKVSSAEELPFVDNKLDIITAVETIYFWDLDKAFKRVYDCLNDNGLFVIINELKTTEDERTTYLKQQIGFEVYSPNEIINKAKEYGLNLLKLKEHENNNWFTVILKKN